MYSISEILTLLVRNYLLHISNADNMGLSNE